MPPPCSAQDPVELLLRSVLRRASMLAGTGSIAACATVVEVDLQDASALAEAGVQPNTAAPIDVAPHETGGTGPGWRPGDPLPGAPGAPTTTGTTGAPDAGTPDGGGLFAGCPPPRQNIEDRAEPLGPALLCESGFPIRPSGLKTTAAYDYLAIRQRQRFGGQDVAPPSSDAGALAAGDAGETWAPLGFTVLSETGSACATATSAQCKELIARHPTTFVMTDCPMICFEDSVVTTRGDAVERWVGVDQLKRLLGEIDSPDDALLIAWANDYRLTCNDALRTSVRAVSDGFELFATKTGGCPVFGTYRYHLHVSRAGEIAVVDTFVLSEECGCAGRRPEGLRSAARDRGMSPLGDFLARCAHLEAASVVSFERLARELTAHGAPPDLIAAARDAQADEVRHAAVVGQLARARGGEPVQPEVEPLAVRGLEEIALENSVEGCVNETFAALIAGYQAEHARDRELREALIGIAEDELRHAILAHRVQRWIATELDAPALARVAAAKARAVRKLVREAAQPVAEELQRAAGLPSVAVASALVGELTHSLWAPNPGAPKAA